MFANPSLAVDCLAATGDVTPVLPIAIAAVVVIVAGVIVMVASRRARAAAAAGLFVVALAATLVIGGATATPATAAGAPCVETSTPGPTPTIIPTPTPAPTLTPVLEPVAAPNILLEEYDYDVDLTLYLFEVDLATVGITTPNAGASIDWASVDLQPDVPGIQHTVDVPLPELPGEFAHFDYDPATRMLMLSLNWSSLPGSWTAYYVVSDTLGALSNVATIETSYPV